jgi:predicted O-methyltransferase YrrM
MNDKVRSVMEEFQSRFDREFPITSKFDLQTYLAKRDGYLNGVGADTANFLNILIKSIRPRIVVEVGTSYGYSTLWLAEAAQTVGAKVVTLELSSEKTAVAQEAIARAGLSSSVEFVVGDAVETLETIQGPIDFALIDLWKELYIPSFDRMYPKLNPGAVVAADNMLAPHYILEEAEKYRAHVRAKAGIESVTVPIGGGVELSYFSGA